MISIEQSEFILWIMCLWYFLTLIMPKPNLITSQNSALRSIFINFYVQLHSSVMVWFVTIFKDCYTILKIYSHSFVCQLFGGNQMLHLQKSLRKASLLEQDYLRFISVLVQSAEISNVSTLNHSLKLGWHPTFQPFDISSCDPG